MTNLPDGVQRVEANDPRYLEAAASEARFWEERSAGFLETVESDGGESIIDRYTNRRFTGDPARRWYETIAEKGNFGRGLFLGTSGLAQDARILEQNPNLRVTICDISAGSLERWKITLDRRFPGRIQTLHTDLNFAAFEEDSYDLVVSSSTLHHVVNLEHTAAAIHRALTKEGLFFVQDYVGESRFRFSETKKRLFESVYNRDIARHPGRRTGLKWINEDSTNFSPFCGIRSEAILGVLASELQQVERHVAGAISGLLLYAIPTDGVRISRLARLRQRIEAGLLSRAPFMRRVLSDSVLDATFLRELLLLDEIASDAELVAPFNAFAVYAKRT
jgi:SAM-dependent methyltransferase